MQKEFLIYLLYITLVEIRERSYTNKDERTFWLCDLLHNVPAALKSEGQSIDEYNKLVENVEALNLNSWLDTRMAEFYERFPEYAKISN
jgi:hypothetical protein